MQYIITYVNNVNTFLNTYIAGRFINKVFTFCKYNNEDQYKSKQRNMQKYKF